jgi:UDP-N-acetylglucosamine 2-epimerase
LTTSNDRGLVFVFEKVNAREFVDSVLSKFEKTVVVCGTEEMCRELSTSDRRCKTMADYSTESELQNVLGWMTSWPDAPVLSGKSIKELFVYDGISLYWFLQTRFYLQRVRELIILIQRIKQVLETEKPDKIWIKGSNDVRLIIAQLQGEHKIAGFEQLQQEQSHKVRRKSYQGYPMLKLLLLKIIRGTLSARSHRQHNSENKVIVVTEVSNWRPEFDFVQGGYQTKDVIFHDIVRKLVDRGFDVTIVDFENRPGNLLRSRSINKSRQKSFGVPVRPWEMYIDIGMLLRTNRASKKFADLWQQLQGSTDFAKSLTFEGVSIYELVKDDFEDLFRSLKAFAAIALIQASKKLVEAEEPNALVMHDEYGALQISLINASRMKGIPSISIQHGIVSDEQISYVHAQKHITGERHELLFPIPDIMCSWSESSRQSLIETAKFPDSVPVVTGDPRVDYLPAALKKFDHEKIVQKLGMPKDKKIITFATENLPTEEEKIAIAKSICRSASEMSDCHLAIKMHPNEEDIGFYDRLATAADLKSYSILRDANLYELLYVSDLVVLSYSTVAVEAMRMRKPVISLDLLNLHGKVPFIKDRLAIIVKSADDLLPLIQKCLALAPDVRELVEKAGSFAEMQLGTLDGMASERIVEVITDVSQRNKRTLLLGEGDSGRK